ncbi:MAG: HRDC domain-containing protein [Chloroflexota bacterium]|nr:HRDC domain-containing protein [Chloroflexota bacterium]
MSHSPYAGNRPTVVTAPSQLAKLLEALAKEPAIGVDTESNSLYAYQEQVCLIQVSTPAADYIVDPLANLDIPSLASLFADPAIQKVFHAAEYDVMCLKRDYGFHFANLFDTMWAARILAWSHMGLGSILKETFNVRTKKRYQRYNWGKRPVETEALTYAALDTHYLLPLRRIQTDALMQKGHWEEAQEIFALVAASDPMPPNASAPEDFWGIKGAFDLTGREQAILRELAIWRDQEASRRDRPLFKVLHDLTLVDLAQAAPRTRKELSRTDRLKPYHVRRYGKHILRAIEKGAQSRPPQPPPPPPRHSEAEATHFDALHTWRKQTAARRGVNSSVIVSKSTLWTLAEQNPVTLKELEGIEGLGPWKRKTYGKAILNVLSK